MILQDTTNLVAQIILPTNTYRVSDRVGIQLDGLFYDNTVISWGNVVIPWSLKGQIGTFDMQLSNGSYMVGGALKYPIDQSWNNGIVIVSKWYTGDTNFSTLKVYYKGIIKNFKVDNTILSFTVDGTDKRNNILVPATVTEKTDNETIQSRKFIGIDTDQIAVETSQIFSVGDVVFLYRNDTGKGEYSVVRQIGIDSPYYVWLESDFKATYSQVAYDSTIEYAGNGLNSDAASRVVPLQFGNLNNGSIAKLGKMMLINNKLGFQKILGDSRPIEGITSIGVWDAGHDEYFEAQKNGFIGESAQKEFEIINNYVDFTVDTTATLTSTLTASDGISLVGVSDVQQIAFIDETGQTTALNTDIITVNAIIIDNEMMLVVQKPTGTGAGNILVERGYDSTTVTGHTTGAKIKQAPKYSLRNLLIFTHRFSPIAITNIAYGERFRGVELEANITFVNGDATTITDVSNFIVNESPTQLSFLRNMINTSDDYCEFYSLNETTNVIVGLSENFFQNSLTFDVIFKHTEHEYKVIGLYPAIKLNNTVEREDNTGETATELISEVRVYNTYNNPIFPDLSNDNSSVFLDLDNDLKFRYVYIAQAILTGAGVDGASDYNSLNTFGTIDRLERMFMSGFTGARFDIDSLKALNNPWKFAIVNQLKRVQPGELACGLHGSHKIFNIAFWADFGIDFTKNRIVGEIQGREVTSRVSAMNGSDTAIGAVATNPLDVIALILTEDMNYTSTDTTASFFNVAGYLDALTPPPEVVFSYGLNEKQMNGFEFIQKHLCEPFNILLYQDHAGLLQVLSLQSIFNDMSPVSKEITLESILFVDGMKLFNIQQTGTNSLYNDFIIKYQKNNATDTYMKTYHLPDETTFTNSSLTLAEMRTNFYGGEKRTKELECSAIWNEDDAIRLAHTQASMYAEPHFYVTFSVEFEHYKDFGTEVSQYEIGDIIHFTGKEWGITFDDTRLFLIQHIEFHDAGRAIEIRAYSLTSITNTLT